MPTPYKGLTIPLSSDLADGPAAFRDYTDSLPYQAFATTAARDAWSAAYNGALCVTTDTGTLWLRKNNVWQPVQPLDGYLTGDLGSITAGGPRDIAVYAGVSNPYPVKVSVQAVVEFGFGQGSFASMSTGILRLSDNQQVTSEPYQALAGLWGAIPITWSWDVPAGSSSGFKIGANGLNFNGFNCYMRCNATYRVQAV